LHFAEDVVTTTLDQTRLSPAIRKVKFVSTRTSRCMASCRCFAAQISVK